MRCDYCGRDRRNAQENRSAQCAPPFKVQAHSFTGHHPADILIHNAKRKPGAPVKTIR